MEMVKKTFIFILAFNVVSGSSTQLEKMLCVLPVEEEPDLELILQSDKLKQDLAVMEKVVLANIFQPKLAAYRQLPIIEGNVFCIASKIAC